MAKAWVVGRIVELAAGVTVDDTAIGCSGDCEGWKDSGWVGERRVDEKWVEAAEWQPLDG